MYLRLTNPKPDLFCSTLLYERRATVMAQALFRAAGASYYDGSCRNEDKQCALLDFEIAARSAYFYGHIRSTAAMNIEMLRRQRNNGAPFPQVDGMQAIDEDDKALLDGWERHRAPAQMQGWRSRSSKQQQYQQQEQPAQQQPAQQQQQQQQEQQQSRSLVRSQAAIVQGGDEFNWIGQRVGDADITGWGALRWRDHGSSSNTPPTAPSTPVVGSVLASAVCKKGGLPFVLFPCAIVVLSLSVLVQVSTRHARARARGARRENSSSSKDIPHSLARPTHPLQNLAVAV
jgi:hypothetical protein